MVDNQSLSAALVELEGIANSPMTAPQRLSRARPVLAATRLELPGVVAAAMDASVPWNAAKAARHGLTPEQWQEALALSGIADSTGLGEFLDALHRADAAAAMLKAGYSGKRAAGGDISWAR